MKKSLIISLITICLLNLSQAQASSKTIVLVKAFQQYLNDGELKYQSAIDSAKNLFEPQITSTKNSLASSQSRYLSVNQVTVLKSSMYSSNQALSVSIDALNCPNSRPNCINPVYLGKDFQAGDLTSTSNFVGGDTGFMNKQSGEINLGILQTVDLEAQSGLIKLNDPSGFAEVESTLRSQYKNLLMLNQQYSAAQDMAVSERDAIRREEPGITAAVLSAKRANSSPSLFEKAFVTSFKFEYNRIGLDNMASATWNYITNLKTLDSAIKVTRVSERADSVASSYTYSKAQYINMACGNTFFKESRFKSEFDLIAGIYKKTTKTTLSLN